MRSLAHQTCSRTSSPTVAFLSPSLGAVSGVSTHANLIFQSALANEFRFLHFQVGSEGRSESRIARSLRLAVSPFQFAIFLVRSRSDIVHLNPSLEQKSFWRDAIYLAIAKALSRRVIYQVHGGAVPEEFFRRNRAWKAITRRLLLAADAVVLLSEIERDAYRSFEPRLKPVIIPNAIDPTQLLTSDPGRAMRQAPLHLAYLGRLIETKGIFEIVDALALLRDRGVSAKLSIAGFGSDDRKLRDRVESLHLSDRVVFRGPLFGEEKNQLWRSADLFAFPTYFPEGLPYALLESLAAGAVPVTSSTGAIPEIIQNEVHGVIVPPRNPVALADAFERLNGDREGIARMASAGQRLIVQYYTVSRLAADLRQLYSRVFRTTRRVA